MRSLRYIAAVLREFWAHWISYLVLSGVVGILISLLIIPALRWVTRAVLVAGGVPYLTLTNAPSVIVNHPFTSIALLAIGILLLALVYLQFAVLLTGVNNIHHHENYGWRQIARAVWSDLRTCAGPPSSSLPPTASSSSHSPVWSLVRACWQRCACRSSSPRGCSNAHHWPSRLPASTWS